MADEASRFSPEYEAVVGLVNSRLSTGPLDVQILPDAGFMLSSGLAEVVNNTLGVPKAVLAKAFIVARRIFFEHLDNLTENADVILDSTSIMLLFDPEHITAANARKKICLAYRSRPLTEQTKRLTDELWFTKFLVTSKLKRHNKSPTLWYHRKWLMKNFHSVVGVLGRNWVQYEIEEVVLISAEHHPKNYYAWDYMRWWIKSRPGLGPNERPAINRQVTQLMQRWCMHHTSDSSGWSFLAWLLLRHTDPDFRVRQHLQSSAGEEVLNFAARLNLKNMSLWKFLHEILGFTNEAFILDIRFEYMRQLSDMSSSEPQGSEMQVFAANSLLAIGAFENPPECD
ncbi:hypothetical protein V491_02441 [Pseudogymnoascus sp. VKM F-3775]|nr:hypothetical protein V491_02441 [Pseudogymnoascus sp. VKM F-3775]